MLALLLVCSILGIAAAGIHGNSSQLISQGCANGGVPLYTDSTSTCLCQNHWSGADCSQPLCINGGTLISNKCACASEFEGIHCEQVRCEPISSHDFGMDRPSLVFVVRVREEMNEVMLQVQQAVDKVAANLQFDPSFHLRFAMVFFNDAPRPFMVTQYTSIEDFDNDFMKATIAAGNEGGCRDGVLGAVAFGLGALAHSPGSIFYVITDALTTSDDYAIYQEGLLLYLSYWRATINFVYVEPTTESGCISDLSDPGFRAFEDLANRFGGMAFRIDDRTKVYDVLYGHMNSIIYKSQLLLTLDREECESGLGKVIQLENHYGSRLVFITRGTGFTLEVTDPQGETPQRQVIVEEGQFSIQMIDRGGGSYKIRTHTNYPNSSCSVRAYQAPDQYSVSTFSSSPAAEVSWAISTDPNTEARHLQPVAGIDNHVVFHIEHYDDWENNEDSDHAFAFLNVYAVRGGVEKEVYASNSLFRSGCAFHYYFPSFDCRLNEILYYDFNVRSEAGFYIQRGGVMTCSREMIVPSTTLSPTTTSTTPSPTPSNQDTHCDCSVDKFGSPVGWEYNGIWLDIVVILDTSEAVGQAALEDAGALIESFISDGVDDFLITDTTSPFYSRVGVISMADTATVLYNLNMTKADKVQGKVAIKNGVAGINVVDAFDAAVNMFNDGLKSKPDRATARPVIYYITDSDSKSDLSSLNEFKSSKGVIVVNNFLQEGEVERPALRDLASDGYYFLNNNYMEGLRAFCKANCYCKTGKDAYGGADPAMQASGGCYHATSAGVPFNKAKTTCNNQGGILASDHDDAKSRFLQQMQSKASSKSDYFWLGYQKSDDGVWRWEDQSTDSYTNWAMDEPSTATVAKCAYVDTTTTNLTWGAGNCQLGFPYVCQYTPCSVGYNRC